MSDGWRTLATPLFFLERTNGMSLSEHPNSQEGFLQANIFPPQF